ncbi:helix-turn-helix domain-containing protein [Candidatus Kaiserbacteria bacterium]|nr:helix-turn-helix domain-containing protein [Candidatus Kaiserbacteria bacterium]
MAKIEDRKKAIRLRKEGKTYGEILKEIDVSKSTLSIWLRSVGLAKAQKQRITDKKRAAQKKGGRIRREMRLASMQDIFAKAGRDISRLSVREFWLCGVMLYWAEGCKEKMYRGGQLLDLGNTDPEMIKFFVRWLREVLDVKDADMNFSLYIHENNSHRLKEVEAYWLKVIGVKGARIAYTCFKKHNPKTVRHNVNPDQYWGTLRVRVVKSVHLQRKIQGWIYGINDVLGKTE